MIELLHRRRYLLSTLAIFALAFALRLLDLRRGSLWVDEAFEFWTASADLNQLIAAVIEMLPDPPLYSIFLHAWMAGGISEGYLRLPSVLFSLLTLAGIMLATDRLAGHPAALLAGLLLAISPVDIRYAQEIGQYSPMSCLAIWSLNALLFIRQRSFDWRGYAAWLILAILSIYTYYGTLFVIAIPFLIEFIADLTHRDLQNLRARLLSGLAFGACFLPLVLFFLPFQSTNSILTKFDAWQLTSGAQVITSFGELLAQTLAFLYTGWPFTRIPLWLPVGLISTLLIIPLIRYNHLPSAQRRWILWLIGTLLLYAISVSLGLYVPGYRHSIFLLGMLTPVIASSILLLWSSRPLRNLAIVSLLLLSSTSLISLPNRSFRDRIYPQQSWSWPEINYDFRPSFEYWMANRGPKEPIYVYYGGNLVFRYYMQLYNLEQALPPYNWARPANFPKYRGPDDTYQVLYGDWIRGKTPAQLTASVLQSLPPNRKSFWIIFVSVYPSEDQAILAGLQANYNLTDQFLVRGAPLYRFVRHP